MSATLVIVDDDVDTIRAALAAMRRIEESIATSDDVQHLRDVADQAALLIELQRLRRLSIEVAQTALRVAVLAWRRIGQLGGDTGSPAERRAARTLARLSLTEVDAFLADFTGRSVSGLVKIVADRLRFQEEKDRLKADAEDTSPLFKALQRAAGAADELTVAARTIVNAMFDNAEALTTAQAASALLDVLGVDASPLTTMAARELVRDAMSGEESAPGPRRKDGRGHLPSFITFENADGEWLRIPSHHATVAQLQWMAKYRREQVRQLSLRADQLEAAAEWYGQRGRPDEKLGTVGLRALPDKALL